MKDKYKKKLQNEPQEKQSERWSRLAHHKKKDEGSVN